jgi:hypothetical protein
MDLDKREFEAENVERPIEYIVGTHKNEDGDIGM